MSFATLNDLPAAVIEGLEAGTLAPYLGPGLLALCSGATPPADPVALAGVLTARVSVPGKIKNRLTAAAQFIENFKHRKTLVKAMDEAFTVQAVPSALHHWLAALPAPIIVDTWYDDTLRMVVGNNRTDPRCRSVDISTFISTPVRPSQRPSDSPRTCFSLGT